MKTNSTLWAQLETKAISKDQIEPFLISKLGQPTTNPTQQNLLAEITKKIGSYYFPSEIQNTTIYQVIGTITKAEQIVEKQRKEGKNKGQAYFTLEIDPENKLQALPENLEPAKWKQIQELAILGQNLVFKYKKWITNKQLLDFYPVIKSPTKIRKNQSKLSK